MKVSCSLFLLPIRLQFKDTLLLSKNFTFNVLHIFVIVCFSSLLDKCALVCLLSIVCAFCQPTHAHAPHTQNQMATKQFYLSEQQWQQKFFALHKENCKKVHASRNFASSKTTKQRRGEQQKKKKRKLYQKPYQYAVRVF